MDPVLTDEQYAILANDISVVHATEFQEELAATDDALIAAAYNLLAAPPFWAWRTSIGEQEIYEATSLAGSVWSWPTYQAQTAQERDAWATMWRPGVINPSLKQTRDGITDIFGGNTQAQIAQRAHLLALFRRQALRIEVLFATGTGSTTAPAVMSTQGTVTYLDIAKAFGRA